MSELDGDTRAMNLQAVEYEQRDLLGEIIALQGEIAVYKGALKALNEQLAEKDKEIERLKSTSVCVYCGKVTEHKGDKLSEMIEHMAVCEKHPVSILMERALKAESERDHWKANHQDMVHRNRILRQRPDLSVDRIPAYKEISRLQRESIENDKVLTTAYLDIENLRKAIGELKVVCSEAKGREYPGYKREKELRCKAEAELDHLRATRLESGKMVADAIAKQNKAEAELAALRGRLEPVEEVYKKHEVWAREWLSTAPVSSRSRMLEFWQAICKTMEGK